MLYKLHMILSLNMFMFQFATMGPYEWRATIWAWDDCPDQNTTSHADRQDH